MELVQQKVMVSRVRIGGQPSIVFTVTNLDNCLTIYTDLAVELWSWESRGPIPKNIFSMYEGQCLLFLLVLGVKKSA